MSPRGADESELFIWARSVAIAVLAGVITKIILFPPGTLASLPLSIRLCATAVGFLAFLVARRRGGGEAVLILGALAYGM